MKYTILFLFAITAIYIPLALVDYNSLPYSDGAEHGAVVQELARNIVSPGEPMLGEYVGKSPRYVPSAVLMAATMRFTGMDLFATLQLYSVIFFVFFLVSASLFSCEYFQTSRQVVWSVLSILFLWGCGWSGANAFMFAALVHTSYYPSLVSFSCVLMALVFTCRFLRRGSIFSLLAWWFFGGVAFVNHPPTAVFLWILAALLIVEIRGLHSRCWLWYICAILISIAAMGAWPYYDFLPSFIRITGGEMSSAEDYLLTRRYLYSDIALRVGPVLVAVPVFFFYLFKRKYFAIVLFFFISVGIYTAGFFLHISLAERFVFAAMLSGQLLFALMGYSIFLTICMGNRSAIYVLCAGVTAMLLAAGVSIQAYIVFREYLQPNFRLVSELPYLHYEDPTALYKSFKRHIKNNDIVLSDLFTSWSIPLYTGAKIVALFHTPTHVTDNVERKQALTRFYAADTDNRERQHIIQRYGVTKILLHFAVDGEGLIGQMEAMGLPVLTRNKDFCIFKVPADARSTQDTPGTAVIK